MNYEFITLVLMFVVLLQPIVTFRYYRKYKNAEYLSKAGWRCTYIGHHINSNWRAPDENDSREFPEAVKRQRRLDEVTKLNLPNTESKSLNKYQAGSWK